MNSRADRRLPFAFLASLVAALSLLLVLGGQAYHRKETAEIQAHRTAELRAIAALKIGQITAWRDEQKADVQLGAAQPGLGELLLRLHRRPMDVEAHGEIARFLALIRESHAFRDVLLLDAEGRLQFSLDPRMSAVEAPERELADRARRERRAVLGDLIFCDRCQEIYLDAAAPVQDGQGRTVGLLLVRSNPETQLYPLIQSWPTPSETAETLLVRREGSEVVFLNRLRHQNVPPLGLRLPLSQADLPAAQAVQGRIGTFQGKDYRGEVVIAELQPVPDSPWFMVAKVDTREILAEAAFRGRVILGFTVLAIAMLVSLLAALLLLGQARLYRDLFQATRFAEAPEQGFSVRWVSRLRSAARLCGLVSLAIGFLVLTGWAFDLPVLKGVLPGFVTMKANTALGFLFGGLTLAWPSRPFLGRACALMLLALGGLTLLEYLSGWDLHIDQLLFQEAPGALGTLAPGRMAPASALAFLLVGWALLLPRRGSTTVLAHGLGVIVALTGFLSLLGSLFGPLGQYGAGYYLQLALHTTLGFLALGLGVLLRDPGEGLLRTLSEESMGGWLFRRSLPFLLALPLVLSGIRVFAERRHWVEPGLGWAILVVVFIVLLVAATGWNARSLSRLDVVRREAESQVREGAEEIRATLYGIGDAVIATDAEGRILQMNPVAERLTGWPESEALDRPLEEVFRILEEETRRTAESPVVRVLREGRVAALANHTLLLARDGREIPIANSVAPVPGLGGAIARVVLVFRDQTEERRLEHLMHVRMTLVDYAVGHTLDELLVRTLDEAGQLTGSPIGFYHFYDEETGNLTLQQWSTRTRAEFCRAEGEGAHYPLERAGVWADCVRRRQAVIHNDYATLSDRKGLPEGHAELVRELVVPVCRGERIVAILGVGNKASDYTDGDLESVRFLADVTWSLVEGKHAERALRESEQRYRRLHESLRDAFVQVDMEGRIVEHNPQYARMLGYASEELGPLTYQDLTPQEWHALEAHIVAEEILPKGVSPVYEKEYRRKDGSVFPVELRTFLLRDEREQPMGMWAIVRDITERKQAEARLREAERMARGTLDGLSKHIAILDEDGVILAVNAAWRRFAEENPPLSAPVCEGANYFEVCCRVVGPDAASAQAFLEGAREIIDGRSTQFAMDYACHAPEIQRWFTVRITRFAGEGPLRLVVAHDNITVRKQAEERLEAQRELLNLTSQMAKVGGWEFDPATGRGSWTDEVARIHDLEPGPAAGVENGILFYAESSRPVIQKAVEELIARGTPYDLELELISARGVRKLVRTRGEALRDAQGKVIQAKGILQDITEKKRAENELRSAQAETQRLLEIADRSRAALLSLVEDLRLSEEEVRRLNLDLEARVEARTEELAAANKELESFAYSVSHDLRAPLRHMDGFLSMLQRHLENVLDPKGRHYLDITQKAAARMGQLVDGLLSFSRLGRTELLWINVSLSQLVESAIEEFRPECANRTIRWALDPLPIVQGDPTLLRLVFQNLVGNALKFTRGRTVAHIEIRNHPGEDGMVGILVRDNGVGFDPAYTHKLFGVFQRLHREDEFEGTGVGLANVHRIISRHGGRVWAEGHLGQGASFYILLPNERSSE